MDLALSFDDVLILPKFSGIKSRKDVNTSQTFLGSHLQLPIVSSNMDSVTGSRMSQAMLSNGAAACLHRFCSIDENVKLFRDSIVDLEYTEVKPWVSIGLGDKELERAEALVAAGAEILVIDVAHGANMEVVSQVNKLYDKYRGQAKIIVGNFATKETINDFLFHSAGATVAAFKVGIGGGSACTTRMVTGCGVPTLGSIIDCALSGKPIIADGGIRNSGDVCKALAAGASVVMLGGLLAGCTESPGEVAYEVWEGENKVVRLRSELTPALQDINNYLAHYKPKIGKMYRGSASQASYVVQNKIAEWRSAEGESFLVPDTGPVKETLQQIEGGLRSAMSYVGANNLEEFFMNSVFTQVTNAGSTESRAHGKTRF